MAEQGSNSRLSSIHWRFLANPQVPSGPRPSLEASETTSAPPPKIELKRTRSSGTGEDEGDHQAKRIKRASPPRTIAKLRNSVAAFRRADSVKSLNWNDVHSQERPRNSQITSLQSEASFASGRSSLSRAPSTGLSFYMNRVKLQTPMSETPSASGGIIPRTAGVSQKTYDVHRSLGSSETLPFQSGMESSGTSGSNGRASTLSRMTPMGASFGPARRAFDRAMSITDSVRSASKSPPTLSKPTLDRHVSSAPYAGLSGSGSSRKPSTRLGDNSLSRGRTTSVHSSTSTVSYSSNASANDRTTPTPRDGSVSSPPVLSSPPSVTSGIGSPPAQTSPLPQHAQRALMSLGDPDTPLKHSRSFSQPYQTRLKVPMPSRKTSVVSFGQSSDASSKRGPGSATERQLKKPEKVHAPYGSGRELTGTRKIIEKRRAEEKETELMELNRQEEDMEDLHVEPIKKGKENEDPALNGQRDNDSTASLRTTSTKTMKSRVPTSSESNSGTSSRTVGQSSLRQGREKQNVHHTSPDKRPRMAASEVPLRFNPAVNERLHRATSTGRYSVPPDDDDDNDLPGAEEKKTPPSRRTPLAVFTGEIDGMVRNATNNDSGAIPMNISPIKEKPEIPDSGSDMMSTTPTESSMKAAFTVTPIVPPSAPAPTLSLFSPLTAAPIGGSGSIGQSRQTAMETSIPAVTITKEKSLPSQSDETKSVPMQNGEPISSNNPPSVNPGGFSFASTAPSAPVPQTFESSKPFSFGSLPKLNGTAEMTTPASQQGNSFSFPALKPAAPIDAPKPFSFSTVPTSTGDAPKGFTFPATQPAPSVTKAASEAPKPALPSFSFGKAPSSNQAPSSEPAKTSAPFSFQPSTSSVPESSIPAASATSATPSPTKPPFIFSTTPATAPPLNITTTPQISPFPRVSESPSPVKPLGLGQGLLDTTTPSKPPFSFGAGETIPSTTPKPFTFGNAATSTTPATTPVPFMFGGTSSNAPPSSTPAPTSFAFGAPPSTTPAAAPSTTPAGTPATPGGGSGFSFAFDGGGINNPFQKVSTATKGFNFGTQAPPPTNTSAPFKFGSTGSEETPKINPPSTTFGFGQPAAANAPTTSGFTFGANTATNATSANSSGLVFPTGPTTPLTKTLELDSMDASPIRGGGEPSASAGPSFREASNGPGFSFGPSNPTANGFGAAPVPAPSAPFGFGGQNNAPGFGKESSPAPFSFGGGSSSTPFGPTTTPTTPFGQGPPGFGQSGGFSFSQPAGSPFGQPQPLASPAPGGFTQLASPAASPFTQNTPLGPMQGQKRLLSPGEEFTGNASDAGSTAGSVAGDGRKIMPMPKPRRARTQAETRNALAKFHRGQ